MKIHKLKTNPLIGYIKKRIRSNKNFIAIFLGEVGVGKSYASLRLAEDLDSSFNINRICFSPEEFQDKIYELLLRSKTEDISGKVVVFEEAGVNQSSRRWYSDTNLGINFMLQSFRKMNLIVLMSVPYADFVDKITRSLLHAQFIGIGVSQKNKLSYFKPFFIQIDPKSSKVYRKYPRVNRRKLKRISFKLPSKKLLAVYEDKKFDFLEELFRKQKEKQDSKKEKEDKTSKRRNLTDKQEKVVGLIKDKLSQEDIAKAMGVSPRAIYSHFKAIEKKGYKLSGVRDEKQNNKVIYYEITRK